MKLVAFPKVPLPAPSKIETLPEASLATARSSFESPLKSPVVIDQGVEPALKSVAFPNDNVWIQPEDELEDEELEEVVHIN